MATSPFEIIAGPADVYIGPVGEAFPDVDTAPVGNWVTLGETEGGVKVVHNQSVEMLYTDQNTGPRKAIRSQEGLSIEFALAELSLETYATALNDATVTPNSNGSLAGTTRSMALYQHVDVAEYALLVRGPSPYMDAFMDYRVPVVIQMGEPTLSFVKNDKAVFEVKWMAMVDPNAAAVEDRFGALVAQDT